MFYVEHMTKHYYFIYIFLFLLSCNKPNPNPEFVDPVFAEIKNEISEVESQITAAQKELIDAEGELKKVVPQTGRQKYAQDKVFTFKNKIIRLNQMKQYFEIKLESQKKKARADYINAFNNKLPYPNPKNLEDYKEKQRASRMPTSWDSRKRVSEYKELNSPKPKAETKSEGHH